MGIQLNQPNQHPKNDPPICWGVNLRKNGEIFREKYIWSRSYGLAPVFNQSILFQATGEMWLSLDIMYFPRESFLFVHSFFDPSFFFFFLLLYCFHFVSFMVSRCMVLVMYSAAIFLYFLSFLSFLSFLLRFTKYILMVLRRSKSGRAGGFAVYFFFAVFGDLFLILLFLNMPSASSPRLFLYCSRLFVQEVQQDVFYPALSSDGVDLEITSIGATVWLVVSIYSRISSFSFLLILMPYLFFRVCKCDFCGLVLFIFCPCD